jgi:hypothetical protein
MIRLLDYLDYLNNEIIQARKKIDERAVCTAKEYSQDEYLQHFRAPKYSMPSVKLDIPLKIADINSQAKYDFKLTPQVVVKELNERILQCNQEKDLKIPQISLDIINRPDFENIFKGDEIKEKNHNTNLLNGRPNTDFQPALNEFLAKNVFETQKGISEAERSNLSKIFTDVIISQPTAVSVRLNEVYFDPDTSKDTDKDKVFINLHLEMVEEGLRIIRFKDSNGNDMEQITVE